ncbi:MAG TPA: DUF2851 family protein [Saprospiraceae bacterium]|nr:DUF2851 family protein [Saprospiraceae bacterium]
MKEELLHYFWRIKKWSGLVLKTTTGLSCEIILAGELNTNAGPDFLNARIIIDDTQWMGNIEMHIFSSDWNAHNHQTDNLYNTVILHVVWKADKEIYYQDGSIIPCIELSNYIGPQVILQYENMINNSYWIPCEKLISNHEALKTEAWLSRLLLEKMDNKLEHIRLVYQQTKNDWEETFHRCLARGFGLNINAQPFEILASSLPLKLLAKHIDRPLQLEALVFGQANLLPVSSDEKYISSLIQEYNYLQKKYNLLPLEKGTFKFFRVRPANFPVLRIQQWISFLKDHLYTWHYIKSIESSHQFMKSIKKELNGYWAEHFSFDPTLKRKRNNAGDDFANLIMINVVIPFLYAYGKINNDISFQEKALDFMEQLKPEQNTIINRWKELKLPASNAGHTQALLYLKKHYCDQKKCLQCALGHMIMKPMVETN